MGVIVIAQELLLNHPLTWEALVRTQTGLLHLSNGFELLVALHSNIIKHDSTGNSRDWTDRLVISSNHSIREDCTKLTARFAHGNCQTTANIAVAPLLLCASFHGKGHAPSLYHSLLLLWLGPVFRLAVPHLKENEALKCGLQMVEIT